MQIHQLPEQQAVADSDMFALDTGQTTRRTPFNAIKTAISTFAHQLTNLTETTATSDSDVLPIDDGGGAKKITFGNLKNKIAQDATPAFNSADASSPTSWTNVAVLTSGEALTSVYNKISAMFKNVRFIYSKLGSANISDVSDGTVTGAISALKEGSYTSTSQTITFPSAYVSSGTITIKKKGSMAMIHGSTVVVNASIPSQTQLYTLPDGYKPYHETYISTSLFNSFIRITSSGAIYTVTSISAGTYFFDGNWIHQ